MELSSLGAINTALSQGAKPSGTGKPGSGFGSLFANLMGNESTSAQNSLGEQQQSAMLNGGELAGLLTFLQKNDILELENGMELLDKVAFQTDANVINMIGEQLNLSSKELLELLSKLYEKLSSHFENDAKTSQDVSSENMNLAMSIEEMIAQMIEAILSLQVQNMTVKPDQDFREAMKIMKLFELLSANKDSLANQDKLHEFMRAINEKLEMLLNNSASPNRQEYLQKTFNNLLQEMNGKSPAQAEKTGENTTKVFSKTENSHQGFMQFQQMSRPEQLTLLANHSKSSVSAEDLIKQFENILSRSQFTKAGGTQRLFIKLNPEHLGALRVELIQKDSAIIARILTSTSVAKEMMESHLNGLKQAFSSQNIQLERVEISQQFIQQDRGFNRGEQQGQERQGQQHEETPEQKLSDFTESFEEALLNIEA